MTQPRDVVPAVPADAPRESIPRDVWVMVVASFLIAIGFGLIAPVLPSFAKSFGVGAFAAAVVISAFAAFRVLFAPGGSWLVTRLGERPVYITGILIVAVSTGACAFAQTYWELLVFRSLGGIGSTMFSISAMGLIIKLSPPGIRGRVSSLYAGSFLLGGVLGPIVGGVFGRLGYQIPFIVYAITLVLSAVVIIMLMSPQPKGHAKAQSSLPLLPFGEALKDSAFRAQLVAGFANGWANFGIRVAMIPLFVAAVLHHSSVVSGWSLTLFAIGNGIALTFAGRLADTIGRRPPIIAGLLISGAALAGIGFAPSMWALFGLSLVAGFGAGVLNPGAQAVLADVVGPDRRGSSVIAAGQMSVDLGTIIGPLAAGLIVDHGSYPLAFLMAGVVVLLAAGAWVPARETLVRGAGHAHGGDETAVEVAEKQPSDPPPNVARYDGDVVESAEGTGPRS